MIKVLKKQKMPHFGALFKGLLTLYKSKTKKASGYWEKWQTGRGTDTDKQTEKLKNHRKLDWYWRYKKRLINDIQISLLKS